MERYGPYRCLKPLGAGGMGAVYLAEHGETGARYALKVLAGALEPEEELRFAREAQAMAAVGGHPHVARVHSLAREGGQAYMVLELVEGGDLAQLLAERAPLAPYEAAELVAAVARGVQHAHERGVLHRDLKPANVLLDRDGRPKVTDFGLAKLSGAETLTQSGEVLGTPVYMAPEQARGEVGSYDARTDVYGLGGVLYACLTGQAPAAGRGGLQATLLAVTQELPPAPSTRNPAVEPWLDALCLRALAKDPAERYASAGELAEALERRSAPPQPRLRRGAALLALGALGALAALAAAARLGDAEPSRPAAGPGESPSAAELGSPSAALLAARARRGAERSWPAPQLLAAWDEAAAAAAQEGDAEAAADYRLELARACFRRGHLERACAAAATLFEHPRHRDEARYRAGQSFLLRSRGTSAAEHFRALAESRREGWRELGAAMLLRCEPVPPDQLQALQTELGAEQRQRLVAALRAVPTGSAAGEFARRALIAFSQGSEDFAPLVEREPDHALLLISYVGQRLARGRGEECARLLLRAERLCLPACPASLTLQRSNLRAFEGDRPGAIVLLRDHLERDPSASLLRLTLGGALEGEGALLEAQEAWQALDLEQPLLARALLSLQPGQRFRVLRAAGYPVAPGFQARQALGELLPAWLAELPPAAQDAAGAVIVESVQGYPWSRLAPQLAALLEAHPEPALRLFAAEVALSRGERELARPWVEEALPREPLRAALLAQLGGLPLRGDLEPVAETSWQETLWQIAKASAQRDFAAARAHLQELPAGAPGWVGRFALSYELPVALGSRQPFLRGRALERAFCLYPIAQFWRARGRCLRALEQGEERAAAAEFVQLVQCLRLTKSSHCRLELCQILELASRELRQAFVGSPRLWRAEVAQSPPHQALAQSLRQLKGLQLLRQVGAKPEGRSEAGRVRQLLLPLGRSELGQLIRARYREVFGIPLE